MKKLLIILLILSISLASINLDAGWQHFKIVNGEGGCEFLIKGSTKVTKYMPFIFKEEILRKLYYGLYIGAGFSQQYTSPRASQYSYNHYGDRIDFSLGVVFDDFQAIYTHSIRRKYDGAHPDVLFFNRDVDSIKIRWKGKF